MFFLLYLQTPVIIIPANKNTEPLYAIFMRIVLYIYLLTFIISCTQINNENFEVENKKLINEYKYVTKNFVSENAYKLNDYQMVYSLDSIAQLFMIDKNKKLAEKFINTEKGLERLNFLKRHYKTDEINLILNKVSASQRNNKDYIEIKNYNKK